MTRFQYEEARAIYRANRFDGHARAIALVATCCGALIADAFAATL